MSKINGPCVHHKSLIYTTPWADHAHYFNDSLANNSLTQAKGQATNSWRTGSAEKILASFSRFLFLKFQVESNRPSIRIYHTYLRFQSTLLWFGEALLEYQEKSDSYLFANRTKDEKDEELFELMELVEHLKVHRDRKTEQLARVKEKWGETAVEQISMEGISKGFLTNISKAVSRFPRAYPLARAAFHSIL